MDQRITLEQVIDELRHRMAQRKRASEGRHDSVRISQLDNDISQLKHQLFSLSGGKQTDLPENL